MFWNCAMSSVLHTGLAHNVYITLRPMYYLSMFSVDFIILIRNVNKNFHKKVKFWWGLMFFSFQGFQPKHVLILFLVSMKHSLETWKLLLPLITLFEVMYPDETSDCIKKDGFHVIQVIFCKSVFERNINHQYFLFCFVYEHPSLKILLICSCLFTNFSLVLKYILIRKFSCSNFNWNRFLKTCIV